MRDSQIIIVGGGPVGIALAIELGQRGIRCTVVEPHRTPQLIPKGQNLTQRTMEHFHFWGVESQVREARTRDYGTGGLTAYKQLLGNYSYDWHQRNLVRPFYFKDNERLPQYATETVLRDRAARLPGVSVLYGWRATSIQQDASGVNITVVNCEGPEQRELRAQYAVGCDGSRSIVREQAGISQTRRDHDKLMALLVFRSNSLHGLLSRFPEKSYYNVLDPELQGYWKFLGRVDRQLKWFFHAPVPLGTTKDNFDFRSYLHSAVGAKFDIEFEHIGFWELRFAIAETYRAGRVFLAGDAAHSHPPYGGYGINTGFEDARNLGWKLAAMIHHWGGDTVLDSYDEERRPVFQSTASHFIERAIETDRKFLATFDPARDRKAFEREWAARASAAVSEIESYEPNYEGSPIVFCGAGAKCSAIGTHSFAARSGHHIAPQKLTSGQNVFEELGNEYTLLAFGSADKARHIVRAASAQSVPLKVVEDASDTLRAAYDCELILVRPDHFIAWTNNEAVQDPSDLFTAVSGQ